MITELNDICDDVKLEVIDKEKEKNKLMYLEVN